MIVGIAVGAAAVALLAVILWFIINRHWEYTYTDVLEVDEALIDNSMQDAAMNTQVDQMTYENSAFNQAGELWTEDMTESLFSYTNESNLKQLFRLSMMCQTASASLDNSLESETLNRLTELKRTNYLGIFRIQASLPFNRSPRARSAARPRMSATICADGTGVTRRRKLRRIISTSFTTS
jgi:hypothetical protein